MKKLQEKLDFLLEKYSVTAKANLKDENTVVVDGKEYPIFAHRSERRFIELKNIVGGGTLVGVSVMRVARIVEAGSCLCCALYREFDLCQWILDDKIKQVTVMKNDNVLNAIATTEKGIVCTIEISATLEKGQKAIDKHEIISQRGIACDIVVDAQLAQDSVYVFGKENKKFTDVDFELYGLEILEIAIVRAAFKVAQAGGCDQLISADEQVKKLVEAAKKSAECGERVVL
ncbi:MAG: hypothetical protein IKW02_01095 [Clostridia bacterium]|nr:hypothetical protein [Clostridia bacterium]